MGVLTRQPVPCPPHPALTSDPWPHTQSPVWSGPDTLPGEHLSSPPQASYCLPPQGTLPSSSLPRHPHPQWTHLQGWTQSLRLLCKDSLWGQAGLDSNPQRGHVTARDRPAHAVTL